MYKLLFVLLIVYIVWLYMQSSIINTSKEHALGIIVTHAPKNDQMGSFITPSLYLLAIAAKNGWEYRIHPYENSAGKKIMERNIKLGNKISSGWGSGIQDANFRKDYDPIKTNLEVYDRLGFFPTSYGKIDNSWKNVSDLSDITENGKYLLGNNPFPMQKYMKENGGFSSFMTTRFLSEIRRKYWENNSDDLYLYNKGAFNIAVHIRRGDFTKKAHSDRITSTRAFLNIISQLKERYPGAHFHIFSAGRNDEGWDKFGEYSVHLDTDEHDTWRHMAAADVLVTCRSNFGYIPGILCEGLVLYSRGWWHPPLPGWVGYNQKSGDILD